MFAGLEQTLLGITDLTPEGVREWERTAALHTINVFTQNVFNNPGITMIDTVPIEHIETTFTVTNFDREVNTTRRMLQTDDEESVKIVYNQTVRLQSKIAPEFVITEPFNNATLKLEFLNLLQGVSTSFANVTSISDVVIPLPSQVPSFDPTIAPTWFPSSQPSSSPTAVITEAPSLMPTPSSRADCARTHRIVKFLSTFLCSEIIFAVFFA